jgi:hypothetical protein
LFSAGSAAEPRLQAERAMLVVIIAKETSFEHYVGKTANIGFYLDSKPKIL